MYEVLHPGYKASLRRIWRSPPERLPTPFFFPNNVTTCCFPTCSCNLYIPPAPSPHSSVTVPFPPPPIFLALHHSTCIQHRSQGGQASSRLYIHAVRNAAPHCSLFFPPPLSPSMLPQPEPRLHEQGQSRPPPSPLGPFRSLHLSFSPVLTLVVVSCFPTFHLSPPAPFLPNHHLVLLLSRFIFLLFGTAMIQIFSPIFFPPPNSDFCPVSISCASRSFPLLGTASFLNSAGGDLSRRALIPLSMRRWNFCQRY